MTWARCIAFKKGTMAMVLIELLDSPPLFGRESLDPQRKSEKKAFLQSSSGASQFVNSPDELESYWLAVALINTQLQLGEVRRWRVLNRFNCFFYFHAQGSS